MALLYCTIVGWLHSLCCCIWRFLLALEYPCHGFQHNIAQPSEQNCKPIFCKTTPNYSFFSPKKRKREELLKWKAYLVFASAGNYSSRKTPCKFPHRSPHLASCDNTICTLATKLYVYYMIWYYDVLNNCKHNTNRIRHESMVWVINNRRQSTIIVEEHDNLLSPGRIHNLLKHV